MNNIVSIGSLRLDEYYEASQWPVLGAKTTLRYLRTQHGGSIANAACVFALLGENVDYYDVLPDNGETGLLLDGLARTGVHTSSVVKIDGFDNSKCIITVCQSERTVLEINNPRPIVPLSDHGAELLRKADLIYTDLDALLIVPDLIGLLGHKRQKKAKLALDIEYKADTEEKQQLLNKASLLLFNEFGLYSNSGSLDEQAYAAQRLRENAELVVVTKGSRGATVYAPGMTLQAAAIDTQVIDTTGAGDTFNAVLLSTYFKGLSLDECLGYAMAAAAICVSKFGARNCIDCQADIEEKLKSAQNAGWHVNQI